VGRGGGLLAAEKYSARFAALERQSFEQAEFLNRELKKISGMEVSYDDRTRRASRHRALGQTKQKLTVKDQKQHGRSAAHCSSSAQLGRIAVHGIHG
jgi:hypothetical protein